MTKFEGYVAQLNRYDPLWVKIFNRIVDNLCPELLERFKQDELTMVRASVLSKLSHEKQRELAPFIETMDIPSFVAMCERA